MTFLDKIRALDKAATPGPWGGRPTFEGQTHIAGSDGASVCIAEGDAFPEIKDSHLIVLLRNALPEIAALVEAVGKRVAVGHNLYCHVYDDRPCSCGQRECVDALSRLDARAKENA